MHSLMFGLTEWAECGIMEMLNAMIPCPERIGMKAQKLPSGKWRVQILLGHDEEGKRIMKSISANTEWEALKLASEFTDSPPEFRIDDMTVKEALDSFIDSRRHVIAPSTLYGYESIAKNRLTYLHNIPIKKLKRVDIQFAINADAERGLSHKTMKQAIGLLHSALALFDITIPNAGSFRLPPKKPPKGDLPDLPLVIRTLIGSSVELPCLLAVWCGGMRISEVRGLQYQDIVETKDGYFLKVHRSRICLNGHDYVTERNKTPKSTRDVPLPAYLLDLIQKSEHKSDEDFIISENYGAIKRRYDRLLKKNGIKMTFHELRAQFATAMNDLGVRKEILQMLGGWSTSKVLDEVYIRTPQSKLVEGMKVFDDYMNALVAQCKAEKLASENHTEAQNHTDHHKE